MKKGTLQDIAIGAGIIVVTIMTIMLVL